MRIVTLLKIFCTLSVVILTTQAQASKLKEEQMADRTIEALYHKNLDSKAMSARLDYFSKALLKKPYLLGALGEGTEDHYDQFPLYRTDAFDCLTYVDTVLALSLSNSLPSFQTCIRKVRYKEGKVSFLTRNHFTCLDWNQNNQRRGFVKDITRMLHDDKGKPVAKIASAYINKPAWYQTFDIKHIRLLRPSAKDAQTKLAELKNNASTLEKKVSKIPYVPLTALFDAQGQANISLFKQIPDASIIEIVRPDWNTKDQIGTNQNVSHLGFAFWVNGQLMFREASSSLGETTDVPLIEYLKDALQSPTIKGINIQIVVPEQIVC